MSGNSTVDKEIAALKKKLDAAIESRSIIDDEFKLQTTLFTEFIIKLSQATKGIDLSLDNKLAKLRSLFTKSAPIADVQKLVKEITLLLQKFSIKKEQEIAKLQSEFNLAGQALQKVNGLPENLRRQLRTLLKDNEETKEALAQYIPLMSQLVNFYQTALKKGNVTDNAEGLLSQQNSNRSEKTVTKPDHKVIERFTELLSKINVSRQYQNQLLKIKSELKDDMPNEKLFNSFLAAFDVISHDLQHERNTAKVFLSTLSETLSTIQTAVKSTISTQDKCNKRHQKLNTQLQNQITDMASGLDQANSLVDIKVDISGKLKAIANTLDEKTSLESTLQVELEKKLVEMQTKIETLEEQSITFEKRIQEQQAKSLQDALTKLNNRAAFDEYFAKETVRYQHNGGLLAIAIADLDDFKRINDTYGHTAGDKTLQVLASTFKKNLAGDAFIARYGGEEFVFIFRGFDKAEIISKLNALKVNIARLPFKFKNNKVSMTLSVGVTHIKTDDNVHIAFERADTALYKAKEEGKNRVIYIQ
ncbi:diguanylate cyclase [Thalassotalea castellviae]|uniref:diguanylate cyclase n=1 Tax=Thalassotalea castellviae TaxID=3075612 RepID=A0ABU2ZWH8_9GAMM|nr:diguanylate cyclase [Thalassotalea sp. W431]MDT0602288.1 diguanylate cyclase [Thalassotalea sp. W431]